MQFIQSDAQLRPVMGRYKVYVILYAEELAEDAGNRLLKTLEEPPPFVVFLLTAIERGGVLPTIASRCQEIRLRPAARAELAEALVAAGTEPERALQLAALAGGRQGWALAAARDAGAVRAAADVCAPAGRGAGRLAHRPAAARAGAVRALGGASRDGARDAARVDELVARRACSCSWGCSSGVVHLERGRAGGAARRRRSRSTRPAAREAAAAIQQTLADLDTNVNARLALDLLLLRLPAIASP